MAVGRELRPQFPIFATFPEPLHYLDNAATGQICGSIASASVVWVCGCVRGGASPRPPRVLGRVCHAARTRVAAAVRSVRLPDTLPMLCGQHRHPPTHRELSGW